jgi:hypothetical protein
MKIVVFFRPILSEVAPQARRPTPLKALMIPSAAPADMIAVAAASSFTSGAAWPMAVIPTLVPRK